MPSYRALCIDGGGINGLVSAVILAQFEKYLIQFSGNENSRLCDYFDFFSGTSAGGILCGTYLYPSEENDGRPKFSADEVVELYKSLGKEIFNKTILRKLYSLNGIIHPKYSDKNLIKVFDEIYGDTRYSELLKPCLIPAYNIESKKCVFYDRENAKSYIERDFYLKDILKATSAAPSYFPIATVKPIANENSYMIDGGVFANNPSVCAFVELEKLIGWNNSVCNQNVKILSVGIGTNKTPIPYKKAKKWGKINWALPIFNIIMDSVAQTTDYQLRTIFHSDFSPNSKYLRVDGDRFNDLPILGSLDDTSDKNIQNCFLYAENLCNKYSERMKMFAKALIINE